MSKHLLPSFFIIGGVKCGTSSLYRYMNEHPSVLPCKSKEPNYFSFRPWYQIPFSYHRYKKMFPLKQFQGKVEAEWLDLGSDERMHDSVFYKEKVSGKRYITGEATATTIFAANPRVIKFLLPDIKLLMVMRDPIDRYVSHYRMYERFKKEGRKGYDFKPLPEYIDEEIIQWEQGKKTRILHQGLYASHLSRWERVFGRENILLLKTKDFDQVATAQFQMEKICAFLNLDSHNFEAVLKTKFNKAKETEINHEVREKLQSFYKPSLLALKEQYQIDL